MRIDNPADGSSIETPCTGCPCHWHSAIQMGRELREGCCAECGCPRTIAGYERWQAGIAWKQQSAELQREVEGMGLSDSAAEALRALAEEAGR